MGIESEELDLPALGRPAFLGQLYNAKSETLLNVQAFDSTTASKIQTVATSFNSVKYKDVNNITGRTDALDINASLSIAILGGMIELKGSGRYLDTSRTNVSTREVTMVCTTRTNLKRLDLSNTTFITKDSYDKAVERGGTHAVTGIVYGGTLVTNITEKSSISRSRNKIHGKFSASIMKKLASKFSAEGKASVDINKTAQDVVKSCEFDVYGDYASSAQPNPTTIGDVFELAKKWPKLVGEGVPCEIIVTPLSHLRDTSVTATLLHQLDGDTLTNILAVYDSIYLIAGRRGRVQAALETGLGDQCPTFLAQCRTRKTTVDGVLAKARTKLTEYLLAFREGGADKAGKAETFLQEVQKGLDDHLTECEADEWALGLLQDIAVVAVDREAAFSTVAELRSMMTETSHGMLGVVLLPESPNINGAVNTFDVLVANIRRWRADEDQNDVDASGQSKKTVFVSYYCDASLKDELLKLDGKREVLKKAVEGFATSSVPRFVHYGELPSKSPQKEYDWSLLNDDGWAFLNNETESWYYVGQVSNGERHGRGTITYADGTTYTGDWWRDTRHGQGEFVRKSKRTTGIFIDGKYDADGVIVNLTIVANNSPVGAYKIPLRKGDATSSHVLSIGLMLGWTSDDEYKLTVIDTSKSTETDYMSVTVVGYLLQEGQDSISSNSWPLSTGARLKAEKK